MLTWLAAHYDDDYKDVAFTIILRDRAWNAMLTDKTVIHTPDSLLIKQFSSHLSESFEGKCQNIKARHQSILLLISQAAVDIFMLEF